MNQLLFAITVPLCFFGMASCSPSPSGPISKTEYEVIYHAGGVTTSSTASIIDDAYAFLEKRGLRWGKVLRIERDPHKVIYVVFPTRDKAGNQYRLRWISPAVVEIVNAT